MTNPASSKYVQIISSELKISAKQVEATLGLFAEGATVPFIARYRKEVTGSLDEVEITNVRDRMEKLEEIDTRREAIVKSLTERELLTDELSAAITGAATMSSLEDIYLPYRPKKRTRATKAKERGLEPLADMLWEQDSTTPEKAAFAFVNPDKGVATREDALAGARDIIAERISDDANARGQLRILFQKETVVTAKVQKGKEEGGAKFKDYFEWSEKAKDAPSHRILAIFRGENEAILSVSLQPDAEKGVALLGKQFIKAENEAAQQVKLAVEDSYKRLLSKSLETEYRNELKEKADAGAIRVFADNLRELLLSSPLGQKAVLGVDPGFRTGCKLVCLDKQGKLLHHDVIYPHSSEKQIAAASEMVKALCEKFSIEAVAIGNGTAGRETEKFLRGLELPESIHLIMVNESGASIYSASAAAREEFPEHDLTVRGAVSIGRRLMDPLAELVKIDAKSIGVGQYQHDVDQKRLKKSLDDVVVSSVNSVGVEVNTASKQLLSYVSGLNATTAQNIIAFRDENGPFKARKDLLTVPRLGPKAYEQAAGFLRVHDGENPLDASAVHPESYDVVSAMATEVGCSIAELIEDGEKRKQITLDKYVTEKVGMPTLKDIVKELAKPGRDPRKQFEFFQFADEVNKIADLEPGMKLPGIVTNVTAFGAFVDVGVHQDGLVHVSQLADRFVSDPNEVVKVHQKVEVTVMEVDAPRKRISLSMKADPYAKPKRGGGQRGGGGGRNDNRGGGGNRGGGNNRGGNRGGGQRGGGQRDNKPKNDGFGGGWFDMAVDKTKK
ncbi:RNA-binding transcriptional accessory protein [bacterium M21]|nr:RNA-binding transcriptional accessory protein [bacterium M21]